MVIISKVLFYLSAFIIVMAMFGYPVTLDLLSKIFRNKKNYKNYEHKPSVTVMVVAHNEEKVILEKLNNIIGLDYPKDKIEFLISSDNSTDRTNEIVKKFIVGNPEYNIRLYEVKARKGKTNAQNEAQKTVKTDFLVMTDANSIMDKKSVMELMASFTTDDISYVSGSLVIVNEDSSDVSSSEKKYWDSDLKLREIESRIQSITAGNGAIYACRNSEYVDFNPIQSHDSAMPLYFALNKKRAIYNKEAIAYEKAGEVIEDEFSRKVRMNRRILEKIVPDLSIFNIFKHRWFSYFYFGHRTCRYLLWITHLTILISNALLIGDSWFYLLTFISQVSFYSLALLKAITKINNRYLNLIYYYTITIIAQWVGVYNILTGKAKPFWEKAESTR